MVSRCLLAISALSLQPGSTLLTLFLYSNCRGECRRQIAIKLKIIQPIYEFAAQLAGMNWATLTFFLPLADFSNASNFTSIFRHMLKGIRHDQACRSPWQPIHPSLRCRLPRCRCRRFTMSTAVTRAEPWFRKGSAIKKRGSKRKEKRYKLSDLTAYGATFKLVRSFAN